ncbi:hypothetical protein CC86DRAFT_268363, partial [Ophiobolus disseminans]
KKTINAFHPDEDAWIMLLHHKLKGTVEAGHNIKFPGPAPISEAFNNFFAGKILKDANGNDLLLPREPRDEISIKGKLGH